MQRLPRIFPSALQTLLASTSQTPACAAFMRNTAVAAFNHQSPVYPNTAASLFTPVQSFAASFSYRGISSSRSLAHGSGSSSSGETISVTFIDKEGKEHTVKAPIGKNFLEVAHENEVDLEGACEASLACSTCHIIFENEEYFKKVPEPTEDELDMLDLAFGLTEVSRLGCQVIASKELDGVRVRIPSASRNFYVDGHKPKPH